MELKLHYQFGRVTPELALTAEEVNSFRDARVATHVSWTQIMVALDETNNPRYSRSNDRADSYQPMKKLTREDLELAGRRIMGDIKSMLMARLEPPLQIRVVSDAPTPTDELGQEVAAVFPFYLGELTALPPVALQIGDKTFVLNLQETSDIDAVAIIRGRTEERLKALHNSYRAQFDAYKSEFDQRYARLKTQIEQHIVLPPRKIILFLGLSHQKDMKAKQVIVQTMEEY